MQRITGLLVFTLALGLAGCSNSQPAVTNAAAAAIPAAAPAAPPPSAAFDASGPIIVEQQVDVAAQREGVVARIAVETGAFVHKGQVLAQLDDRQLLADRDAADAKLKSTQFESQNWDAQVKVVETDVARDEEMFKAQLITAKQLEHSHYSLQANHFQAQRERENLRNQQAVLRSLDLELEKTRIVAPFNGVVARRYIREGQRIANGDRLFWITATAPLNVKFTLRQEFAGKLHPGDNIAVFGPASDREHEARITIISPVVDPSSGTIEVQAQLVGSAPDLLPGMTANVRVQKLK